MVKNEIKIGIIGPRTYSTGGHDFENEIRQHIRGNINKVFTSYLNQELSIMGVTGLGLGVEQDFAICCNSLKIKYIGVLPFENQEERWDYIPNIKLVYDRLVKNADHCITLHNGGYAPKKIFNKNKKIIEISDIIIYIYNGLFDKNKDLIEFAQKLDKGVLCMKVD